MPIRVTAASSALAVARDAAWLPHRYDPGQDAVHFVAVSREEHRTATFLTDELLPSGRTPVVLRRADAVAAAPPPAPLHFLFHSAFCCSTLLARAFDRPGWAMGLKEPVILNDITGWRRRGDPGPDMAGVLDDVLRLLARPFAAGETVVVKPSNVVNGLAPALLALRPEARALLLRAPLPTYLASVAKKGLDGRLWVRTLLAAQLDDRLADFGLSARELLGLTDLQVAALGWLAQQRLFAELVRRYPARVRTLNSETLMRAPAATLAALAELFGLARDAALIDEIASGPAFTRHSKLDAAFGAEARASEHRDAADAHGEELEKVNYWAGVLATRFGIALDAPAPLR